jgi:cytochrome c oxidase subunit 2
MSVRGAVVAGALSLLGVAASVGLTVWATSRRMRGERLPTGPDVVHVEVTANEWSWAVRHPGPDGVLGTGDDVARANELALPVGRDVVVHVRSPRLAHELALVAYGRRKGAAPGRDGAFAVRAMEAGTSAMVCSQLCGPGHYQMAGRVVAMPEAAWRAAGLGR